MRQSYGVETDKFQLFQFSPTLPRLVFLDAKRSLFIPRNITLKYLLTLQTLEDLKITIRLEWFNINSVKKVDTVRKS